MMAFDGSQHAVKGLHRIIAYILLNTEWSSVDVNSM